MDILMKYFERFGEFPFLIISQDFTEEIYQGAMKKAIKSGNKLYPEDIERLFIGKEYDLVIPDEELSAGGIARKYAK